MEAVRRWQRGHYHNGRYGDFGYARAGLDLRQGTIRDRVQLRVKQTPKESESANKNKIGRELYIDLETEKVRWTVEGNKNDA